MYQYKSYQILTLDSKTYNKIQLQNLTHQKLKEPTTPTWQKSLFTFISQWLDDTPTIQVKTSGSTGTPKLIELEKSKMVASAKATGQYFGFQKGMTALLCLPCDYIAGKMMVVRSFVWGLNLITVNPSSYPLENIFTPPAFAAMIPLQVIHCLDKHRHVFNQIQTIIIGGGVVDATLQSQLQEMETACYATYGMTETITHIAIKPLNGANRSEVYQALDGVQFSKDGRGCLAIDAPHVANGKVITNDVIDLKSSKSFEWLGRFDNIINTGGIKVNPEQVEKVLATIISKRFFIAAQSDEKLGSRIILLMEDEAWNVPQINALNQKMKEVLHRFQIPKSIYFISQFVETPTQKIQRSKTLNRLFTL